MEGLQALRARLMVLDMGSWFQHMGSLYTSWRVELGAKSERKNYQENTSPWCCMTEPRCALQGAF